METQDNENDEYHVKVSVVDVWAEYARLRVTVRPDDIMTYPPNDLSKIAYNEPTTQWIIQVAGFAGTWAAGETLHVDFRAAGSGGANSVEVVLNDEPVQNAGDVVLNPAISWIVFTTAPQTIISGEVSAVMIIQTQDAFGNPVAVDADTTVDLASTSATGIFYSDAGGTTEIPSIVIILNGQSTADFYYSDTTVGTPTITAAESPDQGWTDATQQQIINPGQIASYTVTSASYTQTAEVAFDVIVTAYDQYDNVEPHTGMVRIAWGKR